MLHTLMSLVIRLISTEREIAQHPQTPPKYLYEQALDLRVEILSLAKELDKG